MMSAEYLFRYELELDLGSSGKVVYGLLELELSQRDDQLLVIESLINQGPKAYRQALSLV